MNTAYRLLLTINATSLLVIVFFVNNGITIDHIQIGITWPVWVCELPSWASYIVYILIPVLSTGLSILLSRCLGKDEFKKGSVSSIEHANNSFLPSYLGYFFVGLSIGLGNYETLWFVYIVLFVFTFLSQALYFNPLFLVYGFEFYNIRTNNGTAIFLISRQKYKNPEDVEVPVSYRINNYTFIE